MMNICDRCGLYRVDKVIDPIGPYAVCPECGHKHAFLYLPLLVVSGASGTGKSAICQQMMGRYQEAVLLDSDILWRSDFNQPENNYRDYFEMWLRVCKNISQSGRPVVLFGAGMGVPENLENCVERRYFTEIRYLALVCADEVLSGRLNQRPPWRGTRDQSYIEEQQRFNQWFIDYSKKDEKPKITIIDTSESTLKVTVNDVEQWIQENQD